MREGVEENQHLVMVKQDGKKMDKEKEKGEKKSNVRKRKRKLETETEREVAEVKKMN